MRILISADMEGICKVDSLKQLSVPLLLKKTCSLMTEEVNAAADACFKAGAEKVYVVDAHAKGKNIIRSKLDKRAVFVPKNRKFGMMTGINKKIDFCIFIGYHGGAGKQDSFLAHTNSSKILTSLKINNSEANEGIINALLAKYFGAKLIFVSATDKGVEEIRKLNNTIEFVETKKSVSWEKAVSYDKKKVLSLIKKGITNAINNHTKIKWIKFPIKNLLFEMEFPYVILAEKLKNIKGIRVKQRKAEFKAKDIAEGFFMYKNILKKLKTPYKQFINY